MQTELTPKASAAAQRNPLKLAGWSLHFYRLPYNREVVWSNAIEREGSFALLKLTADSGAVGIAEGTLKSTWSGVSPRSLAATLEDLVIPRIAAIDLGDPAAVTAALKSLVENRLAKGMVESACWTLRAAAAGEPLWRTWGGTREVDLTWAVTRQAPALMAAEAEEYCSRYGFRTLKVKGGQGVDTDMKALAEIRKAVGDSVALYVDTNSAYAPAEAASYVEAIARAGSTVAEDPCPLLPDRAFEALQKECALPILVDSSCTSARDCALFLERGAQAVSAKPGRIGLTEAREVVSRAHAGGARIAIGLYAESALGTLISLQFSGALGEPLVPAEQSFYLMMRDQVLHESLEIRSGRVRLPTASDTAQSIDWGKVTHYGFKP